MNRQCEPNMTIATPARESVPDFAGTAQQNLTGSIRWLCVA